MIHQLEMLDSQRKNTVTFAVHKIDAQKSCSLGMCCYEIKEYTI